MAREGTAPLTNPLSRPPTHLAHLPTVNVTLLDKKWSESFFSERYREKTERLHSKSLGWKWAMA